MVFAAGLAETSGLTLPLKKAEDVTLHHGALDVADDRPVGVIEELDTDLSHVTGVAGTTQDAVHLGKLDGGTFLGYENKRKDKGSGCGSRARQEAGSALRKA